MNIQERKIKMNKCIIKIGLTPSNAPFRISNLRTFIYAYGILLDHYNNGNNCKYKTKQILCE